MAELREVLRKYVPESVLDAVTEEVADAATPETFRKQLGELGAKAKRADELEAQLSSINRAPKREALAEKFGVDLKHLSKAERHALEQFTWEGDEPSEEDFAAHISEWEIPTGQQQAQPTGQQPAAGTIVDAATSIPSGRFQMDPNAEFHRELAAAAPGADSKAVLAKYGRLAPEA